MAKIGEICEILNGYAFKSEKYTDYGVRVIRIANVQDGYIEDNSPVYYPLCSMKDIEDFCLYENDLLMSLTGNVGRVAKVKKEFLPAALNQRVACLRIYDETKISRDFLFYYLASDKFKNDCTFSSRGIAQKNMSTEWLKAYTIPDIPLTKQIKIAERFDKLEALISAAKLELAKLDDLVKAKFVEMFGDPVVNDQEIPCKELPKLCEIIDGDRGKNYPTQDEFSKKGYCLFLNAKNVTAQGFNFSECMFITEERDNLLRKGKLQVGDVVLTTRGTIGNLANYNEDVPFQNVRINSGMVILRFNGIVNKVFFITQFRMKLKQIRQRIVSGTAQPQLPISTMSKMSFIVPAKDIQDKFADYVGKIDGIKSSVRKQLENLETLKKSLMQEYFG